MAEPLIELLAADIDALRTDVLRAGVLNAKALRASAEAHVATINNFTVETPDVQDASFRAVQTITDFATRMYEQSPVSETEECRRRALDAIDGLAAVLLTTPPNQRAMTLTS